MFIKIVLIIVVIAVFIIVAVFVGKRNMQSQFEKDIHKLYSISRDISDRCFKENEIEGLPEPVRKYFEYSLKENQPYISYVELRHSGKFRISPEKEWMSIKGREYFTTQKPGFIWLGEVPLFSAKDKYCDGRGRLTVKILSLFKIVDERGKKIDQGELLRWLGESPWFPTSLLPSESLSWEKIDSNSAKVYFSDNNINVDGVFHFNEKGQIVKFSSKRYYNDSLENWSGYYSNYREVDGIYVPFEVEVVWNLESCDYSYAKFKVDTIKYNNKL